jgi:aquaporin Z
MEGPNILCNLNGLKGGLEIMYIKNPRRRELFLSEMFGTAILLLVGLSSVIFMFSANSPFVALVPSLILRRVLNGLFFGSVGAAIALSPIGQISGAHLNPVVTLAFYLMGKLTGRTAIGYVLAQLCGAVIGCLPLILWGSMGRSMAYAVTLPGQGYSTTAVVFGEVITTFCLIAYLCVFLAFRPLRPYTPFCIPFLFAIMVPLEAGISGISVNPARSFGPAVVSEVWTGWWIYWIGPFLGGLLAIVVCGSLARRIDVAKLYHFDSDPDGRFRRVQHPTTTMDQ